MLPFACILVLTTVSACQAAPASIPPPTTPVKAPPPVESTAPDESVDVLLGTIERGGGKIQSFTADIVIERIEPLFNKREVRTGSVLYERVEGASSPRFAVLMEQRLVGQRLEKRPKQIIFDGRWLSEIDHGKHQVIRYELCGDEVDPTRLGGRFPLPVGQPKDEVLRYYEVERIDGETVSEFLEPVARSHELVGLRITPREGVPTAEDFKQIDLWYDTTTWLPMGIESIDDKDNTRRIRLSNPKINPGLDDEQKKQLGQEPPRDETWHVDERPCPPEEEVEE